MSWAVNIFIRSFKLAKNHALISGFVFLCDRNEIEEVIAKVFITIFEKVAIVISNCNHYKTTEVVGNCTVKSNCYIPD